MTDPTPFNAGEPVPVALAGREPVTMVEGTSFCICSPSGDIEPGSPQGLFFRDSRMVSRWQLRLDGITPQSLSIANDSYQARFVLRRPPSPGQADSTLLVVRHRIVGDGMKETLTLSNVGREATVVRIELLISADFADLFTVKEGRAGMPGPLTAAQHGGDLVFTRADGARGLMVHATKEPHATAGGLTWEAVIPARHEWTVEVIAQAVVESRPIEPRFRDIVIDGEPALEKSAWLSQVSAFKSHHATLGQVLQRSLHDLDALRMVSTSDPKRMFMAAGAPWFMTLFGRDSILTAWMTLPVDAHVALGTLHTLASLQGTEFDPLTEEEPGRILHESRLGPDSVTALGGRNYYGTVDATPLFVALLGEAWKWGAPEADIRALLPAADMALSWMDQYGDRDGDGFLEYQRATDRGLANQGWKDSWDAVTDASGRLADPPIALAEVQGYAYMAWLARAELAEAFDDADYAVNCRERAAKLRQIFAEQFWNSELGYLVLALDGHKRQVDSLSSNAAQCLWSGIVSDEHAAVLIPRLAESDMDSGFGVRTLSDQMNAYNPMSYHNGSIWPHDTAIGIAGLMRYAHIPGAVELAHTYADGLLRAALAFGGRLPELFCGFASSSFPVPVPYPTSCSPQAWASAAPFLIVRSFLGLDPDVPRGQIGLRPNLPKAWRELTIDRLMLAGHRIRLAAAGTAIQSAELPAGWTLSPPEASP
jgi:glycogen debranching enzyme